MTLPVFGILLYALAALPPLAPRLEAALPSHLLLQLPALVVAGALIVAALPRRLRACLDLVNGGGAPGTVLAVLLLAYWMLPRALDAALVNTGTETAKLLSLPLVGAALRLSWRRLGFIGRSFVQLNAASMLLAIGLLLIYSPVRLCNAYLLDGQQTAGNGLVALAGVVVAAETVFHLFFLPKEPSCPVTHPSPSPPPSSA